MNGQSIDIVIPLYNEAEVLPHLYQRLNQVLEKDFSSYNCRIIMVDDGSTDQTPTLLAELQTKDDRLKPIYCESNIGHHLAIQKGLQVAGADYIFLLDGDLQDEPENFILLFEELQKGYDLVYTQRLAREGESFLKKLTARLFWGFIRTFTGLPIIANQSMLRVFNRRVLKALTAKTYTAPFYARIFAEVLQANHFKYSVVPLKVSARQYGESGYTFGKLLRLALTAVRRSGK